MHVPPYTSISRGKRVEQGPWLAENENTRSEYEPCEGQLVPSRNQEHGMCLKNAPESLKTSHIGYYYQTQNLIALL